MTDFIQNIKKIILFLFGVILIIWGYKANATNNEAKIEDEKENTSQETEIVPLVPIEEEINIKTESEPEQLEKKVVEETKQTTPLQTSQPVSVKPSQKKTAEPKTEEPKKVEETPPIVIETATPEESSGTE
ncbi:hypothetical protein JGH11_03775 [Dysgonomonas sp. Marseille-P4677]|uniref:hypothetical protein n=1 Tax=Dysgonomonas sp. Marseille-P4677 TaxID=2364790 RepID=UPI001912D7A1|nr:hypothetical protein [Dysgonomonas sp. Marseille-P4677]MBK5719984.1 hypothetical protein [Dysgonomonas sp. Marseille-P4677]